MSNQDPPPFMKGMFRTDGRLYAYTSPPPREVYDSAALQSDDPWIRVAATLEAAKRGVFEPLKDLVPLFKTSSNPLMVEGACVYLIGDASNSRLLEEFVFEEGAWDSDLRYEYCKIAFLSGCLWLAPFVMNVFRTTSRMADRDRLGLYLSRWLKSELARYALDNNEADYLPDLERQTKNLIGRLGTDRLPVWEGDLFSVKALAKRMYQRVSDKKAVAKAYADVEIGPEFMEQRHRFEASAGIDCSSFYQNGFFQPEAAQKILVDFLSRPSEFEEGKRYFFGHALD